MLALSSYAQQKVQNSGWLMLVNSTKINDNFSIHFDGQLRTQPDWDGIKHTMLRPGLTYQFNKKLNATIGYLYNPTFLENDVAVAGKLKNTLTEHRIWQQLVVNQKPWQSATLSHRFRLEQRFIERQNDDIFSQRLRYFLRLVQPLNKKETFNEGVFVALQNEFFFNLQNKDELNGNIFDQNRLYVAAGYRFSKAVDIEAGYLNQAIKGKTNNTVNNVVQLALYTRF